MTQCYEQLWNIPLADWFASALLALSGGIAGNFLVLTFARREGVGSASKLRGGSSLNLL